MEESEYIEVTAPKVEVIPPRREALNKFVDRITKPETMIILGSLGLAFYYTDAVQIVVGGLLGYLTKDVLDA